jgi:hypothetical protein
LTPRIMPSLRRRWDCPLTSFTRKGGKMMTVKTLGLSVILIGVASGVSAQTHPCDQPPPVSTTIASGAPHKVQFCLPQSDQPEALLARVDTVATDLVPVTAKTGPSVTGLVLYESAVFLQVSRGSHVLTIAAYNRNQLTGQLQLGAASAPFPFDAVDDTPLPTAPAIKGLVK